MGKKYSMILLIVLLPAIFFACSSPEDIETQEPAKEVRQQETQKGAEQPELADEEFNVGGLDFNSTPDDLVGKWGTPSAVQTVPGVSLYYYNNGKKSEYSGNRVCFIEEELCGFQIVDERTPLPKGVKIGDSVVKALREYYVPKELSDLGIEKTDSDGEIFQKVTDLKSRMIDLNDFENSRIRLYYDRDSGAIEQINIVRGSEKKETVNLEASDFTADAEAIAEKFGYPDEVAIDNESAFSFQYAAENAEIKFLKTPSINANSFRISENWVAPYDIKIGDEIQSVFKKLYTPEDIDDLNPGGSYISFDLLPDYDIMVGVDKSEIVERVYVNKFDGPQYQVDRAAGFPDVPLFDKEAIAVKADQYISGCTIGNSRFEVCRILGNPEKTEAGFDELSGNAQNCYFENTVVSFRDVTDYKDPKTGRAWRYYTKDTDVIGPRGLRVGDNVEKILEVLPGRDDIDFKTITSPTAIYVIPETSDDDTNSAMVYPSDRKTYSGEVSIAIDWIYGISFNYEGGIITSMESFVMLD